MSVLLNKYEPKFFYQFEINTNIFKILNPLLLIDTFNILLVGNNGTGKTTILNAIINEYFINYSNQQINENLLSINCLREQGINFFKNELKIFCQTFSTIKNKKKIIIIDDIDTLCETYQYIIKSLIDKYKKQINFISSCCNLNKIIDGIQSNLLTLKLEPFCNHTILKIINNILTIENLIIDNNVIQLILHLSKNNLKTIINYIEKFKLYNKSITLEIAKQLCSDINYDIFINYNYHLINNNIYDAGKLLLDLYEKGYSVIDILDNYYNFIKISNDLTEKQKYLIIPLICKYITIFNTLNENEIELLFFTNNLAKQLLTYSSY